MKKLYHGTNSNDEISLEVDGLRIIKLSGFWTTNPGEAMGYAFETSC